MADRVETIAHRYPGCTCPHEWQSLGRLYGISMGSSWVRLDTDPDCPHHARRQP